jgi:hypothetical protein
MIKIPLTDSFDPNQIFFLFSEDAHDTRVRVFCKDVDITEFLEDSRFVLDEARAERMRYHAGLKHERNPDFKYESMRDAEDMDRKNGA